MLEQFRSEPDHIKNTKRLANLESGLSHSITRNQKENAQKNERTMDLNPYPLPNLEIILVFLVPSLMGQSLE